MNDGPVSNKESILQHEVLTVSEVAIYLRVSRVTVWRWCQRKKLPALQVGRTWRIHRDDLLSLLGKASGVDTTHTYLKTTSENYDKASAVAAEETD